MSKGSRNLCCLQTQKRIAFPSRIHEMEFFWSCYDSPRRRYTGQHSQMIYEWKCMPILPRKSSIAPRNMKRANLSPGYGNLATRGEGTNLNHLYYLPQTLLTLLNCNKIQTLVFSLAMRVPWEVVTWQMQAMRFALQEYLLYLGWCMGPPDRWLIKIH